MSKPVNPNNGSAGTAQVGKSQENIALEEPQPLRRKLPEPDEYPIEALGSVLSVPALKVHETVQSPKAVCGQSFLAAASLAVQGYADVEIDGRVFPVSNFFITIADSGERKTATDTVALAPVNKRQKDLHQEFLSLRDVYEADLSAWKKAREDALSGKKSRDEKKAALMFLGPEPKGPIDPSITVEEPTYEGLVKFLIIGSPTIGIFSDEGGRFLGGHGMNQDNQLKTASGLSKMWDGSPITNMRAGDGNIILYGRRVSMHLMMQSAVSNILFGNWLLANQGFLSRCLASFPSSTIGTRKYKESALNLAPEIKQYFAHMMNILETPFSLAEGTQNHLEPRKINLNSEAKSIWIEFHDYVEGLCLPDGEFYSIRGFAAKAAEHVARVAGVLALVENINAIEISGANIDSGITIVQFHLGEALRLFNSCTDNPDLGLAEKLLSWARLQGRYVHRSGIYQFGPNAIRDKATAERIIDILVKHGWFRAVGVTEIDGVKRRNVYEVHQ